MKNFKEIAEKCLAGELSGIFIMRKDKPIHSSHLDRRYYLGEIIPNYYKLGLNIFNEKGDCIRNKERVEDFIPDTMTQKKIEINIPEGKVPVMEQTEKGVVITWKEKEITYADVISKLVLNQNAIYEFWSDKIHGGESSKFYKKVEVLRKLTNIRNYFGKPSKSDDYGWVVGDDGFAYKAAVEYPYSPLFDKQEHAEQAIKMLGDELKYLFEPW